MKFREPKYPLSAQDINYSIWAYKFVKNSSDPEKAKRYIKNIEKSERRKDTISNIKSWILPISIAVSAITGIVALIKNF